MPRFIIDSGENDMITAKAAYTRLTKAEKLQAFIDLACYGNFYFPDPCDQENIEKASNWFDKELTFLNKRDANELIELWERSIEDGYYIRLLFNAIKILQEKYS